MSQPAVYWSVEIRRHHVVVLDDKGAVKGRILRKHLAMPALEAWHYPRWGELASCRVFDTQGRELAAFMTGVSAADGRRS